VDAVAPGRKEALWLACRRKRCCHGVVAPSGHDVWCIARALDLPPASFLAFFESPAPRRDAFALDGSARRFRLALARRPGRRTTSAAPCAFLLRTRGGDHRCGLGALRPTACRAFPAELAGGVLCLREDAGCSCRRWALADVDVAEETALVELRQAEGEEYCGVVARWNARVATAPEGSVFDVASYCAFLLDAYDAIAAGAQVGSLAAGAAT
jgi:hypothetical protein